MGDPLTAEAQPTARGGLSRPPACRAAIWIGITPARPPAPDASTLTGACAEITRFIDERFPASRAASTSPGTFSLRFAGSVTQVMHIADELSAHLRQLSESEESGGFDVHLGVAIGEPGESVAALLHRAEDAAESWAG